MTDFPTALTIIQRNVSAEDIWKVIHDVGDALDLMPCRHKKSETAEFIWTDGQRVIHYEVGPKMTEISECGMVAFRYDYTQQRTHIRPYLGSLYEDYKTIWNEVAKLASVKIDEGWFR